MLRHHRIQTRTLLLAGWLWGCIVSTGLTAIQYAITDLGPVGGVYKINERTDVVGYRSTGGSSPTWRGMVWSGGELTTLNALVGHSFAHSLNDVGQIVGTAYAGPGYADPRAVIWQNGTMHELSLLGGPALKTARDINNAGQIVADGTAASYLLQNGTLTDLQITQARLINEGGLIAGVKNTGQYDGNGAIARAVRWENGNVRDLGTLGGKRSIPWDMNDQGLIVGAANAPSDRDVACYWDDAGIHAIPISATASAAYGVNGRGEIVGNMWLPGSSSARPFLYADGLVTDLNELIDSSLGWQLYGAADINDRGQIIGLGSVQGRDSAYLLTPVPDPTTMALLLPSLFWIWRRRGI